VTRPSVIVVITRDGDWGLMPAVGPADAVSDPGFTSLSSSAGDWREERPVQSPRSLRPRFRGVDRCTCNVPALAVSQRNPGL